MVQPRVGARFVSAFWNAINTLVRLADWKATQLTTSFQEV